MPTQKYRIDTDKGSYEIEVDTSDPAGTLRGTTALEMTGNTVLDAAKGFAGGVIPGAVDTVMGMPRALLTGIVGTLKGTGNLLNDPVKTLSDAYEAVKTIPGKSTEMLKQGLDLAKKDPQAFGRAVGEVTGATEAGIGMASAAPLTPGPVGRMIGNTMEQVGTKGKWPIRMMGAHQLGSGNPMGIATMALPEGLAKGGRAIRLGSTPVGAAADTMPAKLLAIQQDIRTGSDVEGALSRLDAIQKGLVERRATAKLPDEISEIQKQQNTVDKLRTMASRAAKAPASGGGPSGEPTTEDLLRQKGFDPSRIKSVTPGAQRGAVNTNTGTTVRSTTAAPRPTATPSPAPGVAAPGGVKAPPATLDPAAQALRDQMAKPAVAPEIRKVDEGITPRLKENPPPIAPEPDPKMKGVNPEGFARMEAARADTSPIEQELLDRESPTVAKSKSRRGASPVEGLSANDLKVMRQFLVDNPDATDDMLQQHLTESRMNRAATYRTTAGLDKGAATAMAKDQP